MASSTKPKNYERALRQKSIINNSFNEVSHEARSPYGSSDVTTKGELSVAWRRVWVESAKNGSCGRFHHRPVIGPSSVCGHPLTCIMLDLTSVKVACEHTPSHRLH